MRVNPKLQDLQKHDKPINYNEVCITELKQLKERENLLAKRVVEGYGSIWNSRNDRGEKFVKGAFSKSITDMGPKSEGTYKIKFRNEHGKVCSLFEELKEDDTGLYFRTAPLDTVSWADELLIQLTSGSVNNFSIGFKHQWDKIEWDDADDTMINLEARLFEISAVGIPSDLATYAVRAAEEIEYLQDEIEDFVISLPRSKQLEARKIITRCISLSTDEPQEQRRNALTQKEPIEAELDLNYIISKL